MPEVPKLRDVLEEMASEKEAEARRLPPAPPTERREALLREAEVCKTVAAAIF